MTTEHADAQELLAGRSPLVSPRAGPRGWLVAVLIGAAALAGCGTGSLCDPGQTYASGVCEVPDATPPSADASSRFLHFGDVCSADVDCSLPTAYCAKQPGAATGYCTGIGCLADPTVCPPTWACLDLSVYQAGLPAICTAP